jgi:hypothetical protein
MSWSLARAMKAMLGFASPSKGEGEGEDLSTQRRDANARTPHPRPLPLRRGEVRKLQAIASFVLVLTLVSLAGSRAFATPLSADMIVSVPDQELALVDRGKLIARYSISTSKFGTGDSNASYRTPLDTLFVSAKIGDRLPPGAVIKNRLTTGEVVNVDAPGRDAIVARVIWLRGMEAQNQKARNRCIYIRGTPEEAELAHQQASVAFACAHATSSTSTTASTSAHTS